MLKQFLRHLSDKKLATSDDKVLLAVSGGLDSMVMLDLFSKAGYSIAVAHCNFQLRGEESEKDVAHVEQSCLEKAIPFFQKRFEATVHAEENSVSIQMAARDLRYAWFQELLEQHAYQYLATAHHLNDSLETALLKWTNGSSLSGMAGIPVRNGNIIRPLLFATREEIEQYAKKSALQWREDSSNLTDDYQRNFIRHKVTPLLKELNPSLESTFQRGQRKILGEISFYEHCIAEWQLKNVQQTGNSLTISKKALAAWSYPASLLYKVLVNYGFSFDVCEEIIASMHGQSGKKFFASLYTLVSDRDALLVTPHQLKIEDVVIHSEQQEVSSGAWNMAILKTSSITPSHHPHEAVVDAGKITFPLTWRKWKDGDYFYPLGMEHKKKLSDFFIDKKIPISEKDGITVLESAGNIVWVVGYRIDNRFKLTEGTTTALSFTIRAHFS